MAAALMVVASWSSNIGIFGEKMSRGGGINPDGRAVVGSGDEADELVRALGRSEDFWYIRSMIYAMIPGRRR